jgi:hypothetical protein
MGKLSKFERETIINWNGARDFIWVFTYDKRLIRRCKAVLTAELTLDNGYGGMEFKIPYRCMHVVFRGARKESGGLVSLGIGSG